MVDPFRSLCTITFSSSHLYVVCIQSIEILRDVFYEIEVGYEQVEAVFSDRGPTKCFILRGV